jgi:hypothetical protein
MTEHVASIQPASLDRVDRHLAAMRGPGTTRSLLEGWSRTMRMLFALNPSLRRLDTDVTYLPPAALAELGRLVEVYTVPRSQL